MQNSLEHYLDVAEGSGRLMAHARLLMKLAQLYRGIAPPHLYQASTLANYKTGIVIIHAHSGAIAAKLRQLAPRIADGFSRKGIECTGVEIKVQAPENPKQIPTPRHNPLTQVACHSLEHLRDALPADTLRQAIDTLLKRSAKTE